MKLPSLASGRLLLRRGALSLPVVLLAGVIALAAVLAYQAQDAARSNRVRAEATLRDYSAFGLAEYSRQSRVRAQTVLRLSFSPVVAWLNSGIEARPDPPADSVAQWTRWQQHLIAEYWCDCLDSVRYFFRVGVTDGTVDVASGDTRRPRDRAGLPSAAVQHWVRDTIIAHVARLERPGPMTVQTYGAADPSSRRFNFMITNDSYVLLLGAPDGTPRLLAYVLARDSVGVPVAAYGYDTEPRSWLRPLLDRAIREETLLPPSLLRGMRNEQALAVEVIDAMGEELYRSSPRFDDRYAAADTFDRRFGDLRVRLAIYPEIADQLLVGGLPSSRRPLLLALFTLAAGLALVAALQIRRQQQLARLRTDFVSGVSHELRTPLAQIRWFAELLRMGKLRSPEERDRSLRIIDQEARRLAFLVENVLSFSRAGRDAGRVRMEIVNVADDVAETVDAFLPLAHSRRMRVMTALEADARGIVDRAALRQILLNLLDNATKYGPAGQTVVVGVERSAADRVRLWVEDEGPGIPAAERARVWDPFYRAARDLGSTVTGSGIGLSVVNDLVLLQHGRRWVEDGSVGARFVVEFPAPPLPLPRPATATAMVPHRERVELISD